MPPRKPNTNDVYRGEPADGEYPDLAVIGAGIKKLWHTTLESWDILQEADHIFTVFQDPAALEALDEVTDGTVYAYSDSYDADDEQRRYGTYYEMIAGPLDKAAEDDGLVVYIAIGHPTVANFTTTMLKALGDNYWDDIDVEVYPAISSAAYLFSELGIDPLTHGVFQYTCSSMVSGDVTIDPRFTFVGWLFGDMENQLPTDTPRKAFKEKMMEFYDPETPVYAVRLSNSPGIETEILVKPLKDIDEWSRREIRGKTVVIPGAEHQKGPDWLLKHSKLNDEQVRQLTSGTPRDDPYYPEMESKFEAVGEEELLEVIGILYSNPHIGRELLRGEFDSIEDIDVSDEDLYRLTRIGYETDGARGEFMWETLNQ